MGKRRGRISGRMAERLEHSLIHGVPNINFFYRCLSLLLLAGTHGSPRKR